MNCIYRTGCTSVHRCTVEGCCMARTKGWKLVPIEPTEAMHSAANREWDGRMSARSAGVWQAMIAAAPTSTDVPTWADGMERAAELCDEEAHSARELAKDAGPSMDAARMREYGERVEILAKTIRTFKDAGPDMESEKG